MKNVKIFILIFVLFTMPIFIKANNETLIGTVTTAALNLRTGPGTSYSAILQLRENYKVIILGEHNDEGGCNNKWYQVDYQNNIGYVCSSLIQVEPIIPAEYNQAFPESYQHSIALLQALYPNWVFVPHHTGLDFQDVINGQNSLGKSLVQTSNDGWKHLASYDYETNLFRNNFSGGGPSWYAASDELIAYYIDPRNFINERRIFMFEDLAYMPGYHTLTGVQAMLNNSFMEGKALRTAADVTRNMTYAEIFMVAAQTHNVSPYFLAARVIQEHGRNGSVISSGTYPGYVGYYNFYNIGATGATTTAIIENALKYAKNRDWNSDYAAIVGGASFMVSNYIGRGQSTLYYQKFNVVTPTYHNNQYMQNIQAPSSESSTVFNNYQRNSLLNQAFVFKIPIYNNMPNKTELPNPGSPNNWLKTLSVDDILIANFHPETYQYAISVSKSKINIKAIRYLTSASLSGTGEITLTEEITDHQVVVTAENGTKRTYNIKITRIDNGNLTVRELISKTDISLKDQFLDNIKLNMTTNQLKNKFEEHSLSVIINVKDVNGKTKTNAKLATGDFVTITNGEDEATFQVVIKGDVTGNGQIGLLDFLRIRNVILGNADLSEVFLKAADMDNDNKIGLIDFLRIRKIILEA